jgi:hypothetical protein
MIVVRSGEAVATSCLVCGTQSPVARELRRPASPVQHLHERGWYSWRSAQEAQLNCLCPACQSHPDQVAKSIIERQGLAPMVEWLRGWQSAG